MSLKIITKEIKNQSAIALRTHRSTRDILTEAIIKMNGRKSYLGIIYA